MRKKTHSEFVAEVEALVGDEYTVLSVYKNNRTKLKIRHNTCSHKYEVAPDQFIRGRRCPKCFGNKKKTTESFKQDVFDLVGNEYTVLGEYVNSRTKIKMKHNKCSHEYMVQPSMFLSGRRCPNCSVKKVWDTRGRITTESFKQDVFDLVGNEYTVLGEYVNSCTKIKMKHNTCNRVYDVRPSNFLRGVKCIKCHHSYLSRKFKKSTEQFKEEVFELVGNEYSILSEYKNNKAKITIKHDICGHVYTAEANSFIRGARCPKCNESKGERAVLEYLKSNGYHYGTQYTYEDCRDKGVLRFDVVVFNADKSVKCLIEYDGEYHYKPFNHAGGVEGLQGQQRRDTIKTKYCADHNIPLIRIPYWEFDNIDAILTKELAKLDVPQEV